MMSRIRSRLTYANVVATLALVIAVAGGTTAIAITAAKNSVTTKSIKPGNVTARDIAGAVLVRETVPLVDPAVNDGVYSTATAAARCPQGARVLTGGGGTGGNRVSLRGSGPSGNNAWVVVAASDDGVATEVVANALCVPKAPAKPYRDPATPSRE
jgi:hypothetical protein